MKAAKPKNLPVATPSQLTSDLTLLRLPFMAQNHSDIANLASQRGDGHLDYLVRLVEGEINLRHDRTTFHKDSR